MRIFVTGATGFIGSAIVQELIGAGHQVTGLARSEASAKALAAAGAAVHLGALEDLDTLQQAAAASDGVIHTAFNHDFSTYLQNCEDDRRIIEALGAALQGSDRQLVVTSGIGVVGPGGLITEDRGPAASSIVPRAASEEAALALATRGVKASALRLPPSVHGDGDHGFVPAIIQFARQHGVSAYVGDGSNRWSTVHRLDAARAYRLILEKGEGRPVFQAIGDEGVPFKAIADVVGRKLHLPVVSKSAEEAAAHFSWMDKFAAMDVPASARKTAEWLGWQPQQVGLIEDLEQETYFK
jgi:nucleoside-diphosphate-sugar epimerase